jgi:hypothetical protein
MMTIRDCSSLPFQRTFKSITVLQALVRPWPIAITHRPGSHCESRRIDILMAHRVAVA